ncbi:MAG: hypothetical protein IKP10_07960 [Clostridia bacterium]|nr:hypothetical protein [Clostridia bacterium]
MRRLTALLLCLLLLPCAVLSEQPDGAEDRDGQIIYEDVMLDGDDAGENGAEETEPRERTARDDFLDRIIEQGRELWTKAGGKPQRAHYKGDIYVCKNFTTYLFRQNRDDFRMAEYPDVTLVIPDNLPKDKCKPYAYGLAWIDVPASKGNPFYAAAEFRYNSKLSKEENMALAMDFLRQAQRGDFFQMTGNYGSGSGAHSAILLGYDPQTDEIHWMDSNMSGKRIKGIRYGYVQFDTVKSVEWWAGKFCQRKCGATIYRLRDDIVYAAGK